MYKGCLNFNLEFFCFGFLGRLVPIYPKKKKFNLEHLHNSGGSNLKKRHTF